MKKFLFIIVALFATLSLGAQVIHSVDVTATLHPDGSAHIVQVWDATVSKGTEWYIPIGNLDKMTVSDLRVSENGNEYISEGTSWKTDRSLEQKAGRCGIVKKNNGVELCWGQGSLGRHVWTAEFDVTGLVQSFDDYDGFNFMFVNPGIGRIAEAKVTILNGTGGPGWTDENVKIWSFGNTGRIDVHDGSIVATASSMPRLDKIIIVARFDKGMMSPAISRDFSFEKLLNKAKKNSDYDSDDNDYGFLAGLLSLIPMLAGLFVAFWALFQKLTGRTGSKGIYGTHKVTGWWREPPQEGNLFASFYILQKGERLQKGGHEMDLIGAMFLKWVLEQKAVPVQDPKHPKRYNLQLTEYVLIGDPVERKLYDMAFEAAGANQLLEPNEFERWSKKHVQKIFKWPDEAMEEGRTYLVSKGRVDSRGCSTEEGIEKACQVLQFRNFLKDFTINNERGVPEVELWKEYLIFAQMYGIADKVASQLKTLYPAEFEQFANQMNMQPGYLSNLILMNRTMTHSAYSTAVNTVRGSGGGGFASHMGGAGFSGGGFGGGSR